MFERLNRKSIATAGVAILATLGIGGAAIAQSDNSSTKAPQKAPAVSEAPGQESTAPENSAMDPDNIQQGDQTANDKAEGPESANEKAEGPESANEKAEGPESANEKAEGPESANEKAEGPESANEKVADDGPGGHADEATGPDASGSQPAQK